MQYDRTKLTMDIISNRIPATPRSKYTQYNTGVSYSLNGSGTNIDTSNFVKLKGQISQIIDGSVGATGDIVAYQTNPEAGDFKLPIASTDALGCIKIGENLTITEDGTVNANAGGVSSWNDLTDKPSTYASTWGQITGKPTVFPTNWDLVNNKPATFIPSAHKHLKVDITDFAHTHKIQDISDFIGVTINTDQTITGQKTFTKTILGLADVVAYATGDYKESFPIASTSALGCIKIGNNLSIREDGTVDVNAGGITEVDWSIIKNKPSFATVAISGSYNDLSNKPAIPTSLKSPYSLTISLNVTSQGAYDGSAAKSFNINYSNIGAAAASHTHGNYASTVTTTGTGNAITAISQNGNTITATKGSSFSLSSHTHNYAGSSTVGGAANSAVKLTTARTINGTSFDGTANITTANWGTARTLTLGNDVSGSVSINGSANVTLNGSVNRISGVYTGNGGKQAPSYVTSGKVRFNMMNTNTNGNTNYKDFILMDTYTGSDVPYVTAIGISKTAIPMAFIMSGPKGNTTEATWVSRQLATTVDNVASATKLQTARNIWGQSFNGTSNISGNMTGVGSITASGLISTTNSIRANGDVIAYNGSSSVSLANHTHSYLPLGGGTLTGALTINYSDYSSVKVVRKSNSAYNTYLAATNVNDVGGIIQSSHKFLIMARNSYGQHVEFDKGNILAYGSVTAYASSDKRLKKDIKPLTNSLNLINQLEPVQYRWNSKAIELDSFKDTENRQYGLIAQDVEKLIQILYTINIKMEVQHTNQLIM